MHPQYPEPDIKHLIDRLHTRDALRLEDLEICPARSRSCPGVFLEAAGAHTEGSMNVHVETAEGRATHLRRRDLRLQRPDHRALPRAASQRAAGHRQPRRHQARREGARSSKLLSGSKFLLPVHDKPAKIEHGQVVGRLDMAVPGPIVPVGAARATGSRRERRRRLAMTTHVALGPAFRRPDRRARAGAAGRHRLHRSPKGRSGTRQTHYLLFSDMPGDVRRRLDRAGRARGDAPVEQVQRHDL